MDDLNFSNDIELISRRPPSLERSAEIIKKSLEYYLKLKNLFLMGSSEEKENARKAAILIMDRINEEVAKTCKAINLNPNKFFEELLSQFSLKETIQYKEANAFINTHRNEIFCQNQSKPKVARSSAKLIKNKTMILI
jgi:hypothetical protein